MAEYPKLLNGEMARAYLAGLKTQTRSPMWTQPVFTGGGLAFGSKMFLRERGGHQGSGEKLLAALAKLGPFGKPGDSLWVREAWRYHDWTEDGDPWIEYRADGEARLIEDVPDDWRERVNDVWADLSDPANFGIDGAARDRKWRPSILMPRWACRLVLPVKVVWVERVQDVSAADAIAEGIKAYAGGVGGYKIYTPTTGPGGGGPCKSFASLWDSIYAEPRPRKEAGIVTHYVSYPWGGERKTREHNGLLWRVFPNPLVWACEVEPWKGEV